MQNTSSKTSIAPTLHMGLSWILLSILIWVIGVSIGYPLGDTVGRVYSPDGYWAPSGQKTYLVDIVASLIFGLAMGLGQGLLFQKYKLVDGWRWFAGTFGGFLIVAVIANRFHLQYLQMINAVILIGGFDLPPAWLQLFSPWDRFLVGPYAPAEFRYVIWLAIVVGLVSWLSYNECFGYSGNRGYPPFKYPGRLHVRVDNCLAHLISPLVFRFDNLVT